MSQGLILVIEDNRDNQEFILDLLASFGYGTLLAADGETGLQMARSEHPDLILLDLSLPRMDGWTTARILKAEPELQHTPVIALTAHAMQGDRDRALSAGCDDYLTKPIDLQELARKLALYTERRGAKS